VPKNNCGSTKMNDKPVAAPDDFEIVAVIKPKPMFESENNNTNVKANM